jgi:hypothetical protein
MPGTHVLYRRSPWRLQAKAVLAAVLVHAVVLVLMVLPVDRAGDAIMTIAFVTDLEDLPPTLTAPGPDQALELPVPVAAPELEVSAARVRAAGTIESPATAVSREAVTLAAIPFFSESEALPFTAVTEARGAALPLVVGSGGGIGRRRLERTPEQIATARAESLLFARMADIAVAERQDTGTVGLANGGVTLAIPWSGFLPADRRDSEWRKERCSGDGGGDSDKAGESEARRAQC